MSKQSEDLRDQAWRARRLSQTVSDDPSSKSLRVIAQKYEDDANRLEMSERPADSEKTHPHDGWISLALSDMDTGSKNDHPKVKNPDDQ